MSRKKIVKEEVRIERRIWDRDDDYLVVPDIQVFETDGFKEGDKVKVTIEKL